mgnify:CR=1 FL=1
MIQKIVEQQPTVILWLRSGGIARGVLLGEHAGFLHVEYDGQINLYDWNEVRSWAYALPEEDPRETEEWFNLLRERWRDEAPDNSQNL